MSKIFTLSNRKTRLYEFRAEALNHSAEQGPGDETAYLIEGMGETLFQEMQAVEAMIAGDYSCLLTVSENGAELLHLPCKLTFVLLEPDRFAARVTLES